MLIVASDVSTEIYYSRCSDRFKEAKLQVGLDFDSSLQLYSAPLILGYYAVAERDGVTVWESPEEGLIFYRPVSDLVLLVVQIESDEQLAQRYLDVVSELIELICGPLASYSLSCRSRHASRLSSLLARAVSALLDNDQPVPPILLPERVFMSAQLHRVAIDPLAKLWSGSEYIAALICKSKVVRSFRLRGNISPSCVKCLAAMQAVLDAPAVLFLPTQHGKRMFLAESASIFEGIDLLVLSPVRGDDSNFLGDVYHWEEVLLHLSRHSNIIENQLADIELVAERLFETIPDVRPIWIDRVRPVLQFLSREEHDKYAKKKEFNAKFAAVSTLTGSFASRLPRTVPELLSRFAKTKIPFHGIGQSAARPRSRSGGSLGNIFTQRRRSGDAVPSSVIQVRNIINPVGDFLNAKFTLPLPQSALPSECVGLIIWWRESNEILTSQMKSGNTREELFRTFWLHESDQATFYRVKKDDGKVLFRVRVRGKFLLGLVKAETIADASFIVTGKISWSIKDILA